MYLWFILCYTFLCFEYILMLWIVISNWKEESENCDRQIEENLRILGHVWTSMRKRAQVSIERNDKRQMVRLLRNKSKRIIFISVIRTFPIVWTNESYFVFLSKLYLFYHLFFLLLQTFCFNLVLLKRYFLLQWKQIYGF